MIKRKWVLSITVAVTTLFGQEYELDWEKGFRSDTGAQSFNSLTSTKDGNLIATGESDYDKWKQRQVLVVKISTSGEVIWEKKMSVEGKYDSYGQSCVELANGNWLIGGYSDFESLSMILNSDGVKVSDTTFERNSIINKFLVKENGEILGLLADQYPGVDRDGSFAMIFTYNSDGVFKSQHLIDNSDKLSTVAGYDIEHYPGKGYIIAGAYGIRAVDYEFQELWYRNYSTPRNGHHTTSKMIGKITEPINGSFGVAGYCGEKNFNPQFEEKFDPWVATIDSVAINKTWDITAESFTDKYSGKYNDYLRDIQRLTDSSYVVTGNHVKGDAYVAVVHRNGEILWDSNFSGPGGEDKIQTLLSVVTTNDGGFAVSGSYQISGIGKTEEHAWIRKYRIAGSSTVAQGIVKENSAVFSIVNNTLRSTKSTPYNIEIFSARGQLLKEISGVELQINLNTLGFASGIYQVRVVQGVNVFTEQFILR